MDGPETQAGPAEAPAPERPDGPLKQLYREELQAWRTRYRRYFRHAARALGLGFVAGFLYFQLWPAREAKALDLVVQSLKDISLEAPPQVTAVTLFYHNARASVVAVAAGAVPFLFLPILDPILNGGVLGLLVSIARHNRLDVPRLVLTRILPHGVLELAAVLYATSLGLYLSAAMSRKVAASWKARKRRRSAGPAPAPEPEGLTGSGPEGTEPAAPNLIRDVVRSFVLVVLPLLAVAAFIEAFITPNLR